MGIGYQFIDIFQTFLRFGKNDDMISRFAFVIDRPILVSAVCIIENISLHAVNNLDFSSLFRLFFCFCRTVRECLHNSMICNSDCRMTPFCCLCYDVLWLVKTVHLAHLGVDMKFHTFAIFACIVSFQSSIHLFQIFEHNCIHVLKGIPLYFTSDFYAISRFKQRTDLIPLILGNKCLGTDSCLIVGNQEGYQIVSTFDDSLAHAEKNAFQNHCSQLRHDFTQLRCFTAKNIASHDAVSFRRKFFFFPFPAAFASLRATSTGSTVSAALPRSRSTALSGNRRS